MKSAEHGPNIQIHHRPKNQSIHCTHKHREILVFEKFLVSWWYPFQQVLPCWMQESNAYCCILINGIVYMETRGRWHDNKDSDDSNTGVFATRSPFPPFNSTLRKKMCIASRTNDGNAICWRAKLHVTQNAVLQNIYKLRMQYKCKYISCLSKRCACERDRVFWTCLNATRSFGIWKETEQKLQWLWPKQQSTLRRLKLDAEKWMLHVIRKSNECILRNWVPINACDSSHYYSWGKNQNNSLWCSTSFARMWFNRIESNKNRHF